MTEIALASSWDTYTPRQKQQHLVWSAQKQYNRKHLQSNRRSFRRDCSGFVHTVLWDNGHSLDDFYRAYQYHTNGVDLIYQYVKRIGWVYKLQQPEKGDLVFFSNTYDKNKDGKYNDLLTHIGIIENIEKDGTITFLHYIQNKVRRGYMNLQKPGMHRDNQKTINSYLSRKTSPTKKTLASQLFTEFGHLQPRV
ncbi:MAG: C40 family peptidase [Deltaproteobacteria bacterium]|nr:C40 family peptidase [Deltaproteobacteria bacterium]